MVLLAAVKEDENELDWSRWDSWKRAARVTAWAFRFTTNCRERIRTRGSLTAEEIRRAEWALIRVDQKRLTSHRQRIIEIDENGVHRLRSRIGNSKLSERTRCPILLPKGSRVAALIIRDLHEQLKHGGVDTVLTEFLQDFWMPASRQTVKRTLKRCLKCRKMQAPMFELPKMPPLPADRVRRHMPFETVGVDFLGPTVARDDNGNNRKAWVLLITCLTVRAVFLEPTREMSAAGLANVLRRFIARRGAPNRIISDNAPQFLITGRAMGLFRSDEADLQGVAAARGIEWRFIAQHSPWAGGVYERLVQSCKRALQRTFGRFVMSYDELATALAEVEAAINLRPLTYVSDAEGAPIPLRPIDFIQENTRLRAYPGPVGPLGQKREEPHLQLNRLWAERQAKSEEIWQRWAKEYLLVLREKAGWNHRKGRLLTKRAPVVGEVVLIEDQFRPRNTWPIGRIIEVQGHGQAIRSV